MLTWPMFCTTESSYAGLPLLAAAWEQAGRASACQAKPTYTLSLLHNQSYVTLELHIRKIS
jgi:hypothetical protein